MCIECVEQIALNGMCEKILNQIKYIPNKGFHMDLIWINITAHCTCLFNRHFTCGFLVIAI